jgi:hypothetical protein
VTRELAPRAGRLALAMLGALLLIIGCRRPAIVTPAVDVTWALSPAVPIVGPATLTITLRRPSGEALAGAAVRLEGHMTHPGMAPVVADATERTPGVYDLPFEFTMQGDWVLLVSAAAPRDGRIEHRIDVPNVRPGG